MPREFEVGDPVEVLSRDGRTIIAHGDVERMTPDGDMVTVRTELGRMTGLTNYPVARVRLDKWLKYGVMA